ncbi:hypothetical protein Pla123a_35860 [Posidoniimonas polymericola]|uniref:Uncharacterized protein n=1 Tax=Posidoniimonas polymericola TaxID=2528002 RepID=A0A5C5YFV4_9BACT|nr:hypothetical protein [Posidoniimonas polymericola]TWT73693.1 hypothetical protein Pla123a_35860 [Posidoniimonas polymericola]
MIRSLAYFVVAALSVLPTVAIGYMPVYEVRFVPPDEHPHADELEFFKQDLIASSLPLTRDAMQSRAASSADAKPSLSFKKELMEKAFPQTAELFRQTEAQRGMVFSGRFSSLALAPSGS